MSELTRLTVEVVVVRGVVMHMDFLDADVDIRAFSDWPTFSEGLLRLVAHELIWPPFQPRVSCS